MPTVYFLIGIPASGKSTIARQLGCRIICPDDVRARLDLGPTAAEGFAEAHRIMVDALTSGQDIVFDATNTIAERRKQTLDLIRPLADRIIAVFVDTPIRLCIERQQARMRKGIRMTLMAEDIVRMNTQLNRNWPMYGEGFSAIVRIRPKDLGHCPLFRWMPVTFDRAPVALQSAG